MCLKTESGQYVVAAKNGGFATGSTDPESATRWEYWIQNLHSAELEIVFQSIFDYYVFIYQLEFNEHWRSWIETG